MLRDADLTEDAFLGGRVRLLQPRHGYRAATDPVFLAAAVPARAGETVLDLGAGAGAALFCLAARVPEVRLTGLEIQPEYADLARRNAALNDARAEVIPGDVAAPPPTLSQRVFDHVMLNPPFHAARTAAAAVDPGRDRAHREGEASLAVFLDLALRRLAPGGSVTVIQRAERLADILGALGRRVGAVRILPLQPRRGRAAKRVLVQARKGAAAPLALLAPLTVHSGARHDADRPDFSAAALTILRDGAPLML